MGCNKQYQALGDAHRFINHFPRRTVLGQTMSMHCFGRIILTVQHKLFDIAAVSWLLCWATWMYLVHVGYDSMTMNHGIRSPWTMNHSFWHRSTFLERDRVALWAVGVFWILVETSPCWLCPLSESVLYLTCNVDFSKCNCCWHNHHGVLFVVLFLSQSLCRVVITVESYLPTTPKRGPSQSPSSSLLYEKKYPLAELKMITITQFPHLIDNIVLLQGLYHWFHPYGIAQEYGTKA